MSKTPNLRFNEFSEKWEEKKLGELLEFKNGINASKEQYGKGIKFINVLDVLNNDYITYDNIIGKVDVDQKTLENNSVEYGDILFQRSSETREEVGTANVYLDKEKKATFGGFIIRGKKIGDYNPIFMNKLLKTSSARKEITSRSGGSTRYNVGQEILKDIDLFFPSEIEQKKIAKFFSLIDKKIQKQQEKVEALKDYKKGMMQKIFSQEIRFKGENGEKYPEWEELNLGEICEIKTGKLDANAMVDNGQYRFYTCAKEYFHIDNYYFDTEALLISGNGANLGYIHYYSGKFNAYQRTYVLDKFSEHILYIRFYLEQYLKRRILEGKNDGNTPYIVLSTLSDMPIAIPNIKEQIKIANVFVIIDKKLKKEQEKLDSLNQWKKGLLQQMFV